MHLKYDRFTKNKGSITVESCLTIPLFLFFFLAVASIIMIFFGEAHIHQSLATAGEIISRCYYTQQDKEDEQFSDIVNSNLLKKEFFKALGDDYYVSRSVSGGKNGIILTYNRDCNNPKIFYLKAHYQVKFYIPAIGSFHTKRTITIKQKGFVGYTKGEEEIDPYVYITPNQEVYHCSRNCTHLSLSVREIDGNNRNIYEPCHFCRYRVNETGRIYVARTTNIYHENRGCSGLKRSVRRVKKSSVSGLPPCERCGR